MDYGIVGMIFYLGLQLLLAVGVVFVNKLSKVGQVFLVFIGEGGISEGEFYEVFNMVVVWELLVFFVIENNGYGLFIFISEQYCCEQFVDWVKGYGMWFEVIDGNNILEVYEIFMCLAIELWECFEFVLIECCIFCMCGYEEVFGIKYVLQELMDEWVQCDFLDNYECFLLQEGVFDEV